METNKTVFDKAILHLKSEINASEAPDFSANVINRLNTSHSSVITIKRYMIAAVIAMMSLNIAATWYVWSYQSETNNEQAFEDLYSNQSSWSTFLTQAE